MKKSYEPLLANNSVTIYHSLPRIITFLFHFSKIGLWQLSVNFRKHRTRLMMAVIPFLIFVIYVTIMHPLILFLIKAKRLLIPTVFLSAVYFLTLMYAFTLQFFYAGLAISSRLRLLNRNMKELFIR